MRSKPVKIWFLDHSPDIGGGEMALLHVVPELPANFDVEIVAPDGDFARAAEGRGLTVRRLTAKYRNLGLGTTQNPAISRKLGALKSIAGLFFQIRREVLASSPDLLYCNTLRMCLVGGIVGKLYKTPVIWHVRDSLAYPYVGRFTSSMLHLAMRATASTVVANSLYTAGQLRGIDSTVVGSPIADDFFTDVRPLQPERVAKDFVMVGRFAPWKGQLEAVQAFALAFPEGEQRLVLVGGALFEESVYMERVRKEAVDLGVAKRVEFLGHSDDVVVLMRSARAVVHASTLPEPLGQVTIQASALGRPLIVADAGGPADLFEDEVNAKMHTPGDVRSLAAALNWIVDHPGDSELMGSRAREVAEPYRLCAITPQTELVVSRTLNLKIVD
ncbi:glycosyltransferase family 4 protein [Rhodococcus fascians]|uniref:glycosyltransferase family 4 protein n=1 Tax=Rhodococcoides fascians TaxID=1828 RepID=UPI0024B63EDF|nr:glycosyltransferase family 4 protein [Rhodococcus fascians]MDJ0002925.1 glycosyltransferase family 4 protein [Rhodococcus fascians]